MSLKSIQKHLPSSDASKPDQLKLCTFLETLVIPYQDYCYQLWNPSKKRNIKNYNFSGKISDFSRRIMGFRGCLTYSEGQRKF